MLRFPSFWKVSGGMAFFCAVVLYALTESFPHREMLTLPQGQRDLKNGERLYHVGGCIGCHRGKDPAVPSGGTALSTPIGTLYPPNLTPDPKTGLGLWSDQDFIVAMREGISRTNTYYLPAFPYASYRHMTTQDLLDLKAYLSSLPSIVSPPHSQDIFGGRLGEWVLRRAMGIWTKLAFYTNPYPSPFARSFEGQTSKERGEYLVVGPGHCAECHTPRTLFMTFQQKSWFAGGPHPEGKGRPVPSLRGLLEREEYESAQDLADALQYGESMGYEGLSAGGMGTVQTNLSHLPRQDLESIAAYLTSLKSSPDVSP